MSKFMSDAFWGIEPPKEDAMQSDQIHFPNPLKIEVDGKIEETMVGIQPVEVLLGKIHIHWSPDEEEK